MSLQNLETELKIRGYTPATLRAYRMHNKHFMEFIKKEPEQVTEQDIKLYLAHLMADKNHKSA